MATFAADGDGDEGSAHDGVVRPDASATGSWKTGSRHFEANTGLMPQAKGGSLIASYQYMDTDGYRTFGHAAPHTYFFKYLQPVGEHATLTFMGEYNTSIQQPERVRAHGLQ